MLSSSSNMSLRTDSIIVSRAVQWFVCGAVIHKNWQILLIMSARERCQFGCWGGGGGVK